MTLNSGRTTRQVTTLVKALLATPNSKGAYIIHSHQFKAYIEEIVRKNFSDDLHVVRPDRLGFSNGSELLIKTQLDELRGLQLTNIDTDHHVYAGFYCAGSGKGRGRY